LTPALVLMEAHLKGGVFRIYSEMAWMSLFAGLSLHQGRMHLFKGRETYYGAFGILFIKTG
jgi:hypothetical protein